MEAFKTYLIKQDYAKSSITTYLRSYQKFIGWCHFKGYNPEQIDYKTCLDYVKELQKPVKGKSISKKSVSAHIGALKIYFKFLIEENERGDNPMQDINIRGIKRNLNHNLLEFDELEDLFYSFPTLNIEAPNCSHVAIRNKVIVGLMVYQGLNATALLSLKLEHVNIDKGKIYIPSTRKTNSRELELKSPQMLSLVQYLQSDRIALQDKIECHTEALFPLKNQRSSVLLATLFKRLKRINYKVKDTKQIRASVITYWLKLHNIRKVQYMVGHRYISSTERYLKNDIESLQELITLAHPMK